eukprot:TRINITY_DN8761_c0_g1_i1.p1 TRINITY_DN8761_c0_g1~~TRINITY_DN8761_c0_g1_i1.p1  ORF type:complete len:488 (-),score=76.49 TRINITY_DN8761_c0_g1_i1:107-1429(-)
MTDDPATDEAALLCEKIFRISGGCDCITNGELKLAEKVERTCTSLIKTLKVARKRGLMMFGNRLLLQGKHPDVEITLTSNGLRAANAARQALAKTAKAAIASKKAQAPAEARILSIDRNGSQTPPLEVHGPSTASDFLQANAEAHILPVGKIGSQARAPAVVHTEPLNSEAPAVVHQEPHNSEDEEVMYVPGARQAAETQALGPAVVSALDSGSYEPSPSDSQSTSSSTWTRTCTTSRWSVDLSYLDWRSGDSVRTGTRSQPMLVPSQLAARTDSPCIERQQMVSPIPARRRSVTGISTADLFPSQAQEEGKAASASPARCRPQWSLGNGPLIRSLGGTVTSQLPSVTVKQEADGKWKVDAGSELSDIEPVVFASPSERKYSHAELRAPIAERPADVDPSMREAYLADEEFQQVFEMTAGEFSKLPKWKQQALKKANDLF